MISLLSTVPHFADTIAHRGWHAWWTESGVPLSEYRAHLEPMLQGQSIPFGLVAHEGDRYLGSCLVIESDLEARPQYAPWIAALWVDAEHRGQGVAANLIGAARAAAAVRGHKTCYLCATQDNSPYYLARGFKEIERDVAGLNVFRIG